MQSLKSRLFIWMIRNRHLFKLKLKPETVDETFSVEKFRAEVDRATARIKMPGGVTVRQETANGVGGEWIIPDGAEKGKVLLYIHGGGFISGSCNTHRMHVAKFAKGTGLRAFVFDYRLAPEHPFPAAPEDCMAVYQWLLESGYGPRDILVGGESAGGTLVLSLLLALKEEKMDLPRAAFSISPVTDLRCLAGSFTYNAGKDIAPMGSWTVWTRMYIGDNDPALPPLSPQMGDFTGLPPLHICVGTHEIHLDDCVAVAEKAKGQGVDVVLRQWPGMVHAFPILAPLFPEAETALADICGFAKNKML